MNKLIVLSAASVSQWAQAHDGHGLEGSHWHASDTLGFVAVLVVVAAVWWTRRK
jgi:Co/Zn/Cd efflux system component